MKILDIKKHGFDVNWIIPIQNISAVIKYEGKRINPEHRRFRIIRSKWFGLVKLSKSKLKCFHLERWPSYYEQAEIRIYTGSESPFILTFRFNETLNKVYEDIREQINNNEICGYGEIGKHTSLRN